MSTPKSPKIHTVHLVDVQRGRSFVLQAEELIHAGLSKTGIARARDLETARVLLGFAHDYFGLAAQQELIDAVFTLEKQLSTLAGRSVLVPV